MKEKLVYSGPIFDFIQTEVEIKGKTYPRDIIKVPGGVGILVVIDGNILLVKQHRAAIDAYTLEIPAGKLEYGEDPKATAFRELNEETGYDCKDLVLIHHFVPTPAFCNENIWIYKAIEPKVAASRLEMDEDEEIELFWIPLEQAYAMIQNEEIQDAKTMLAIYYAYTEGRKF